MDSVDELTSAMSRLLSIPPGEANEPDQLSDSQLLWFIGEMSQVFNEAITTWIRRNALATVDDCYDTWAKSLPDGHSFVERDVMVRAGQLVKDDLAVMPFSLDRFVQDHLADEIRQVFSGRYASDRGLS